MDNTQVEVEGPQYQLCSMFMLCCQKHATSAVSRISEVAGTFVGCRLWTASASGAWVWCELQAMAQDNCRSSEGSQGTVASPALLTALFHRDVKHVPQRAAGVCH
jgi:hypothetical protein